MTTTHDDAHAYSDLMDAVLPLYLDGRYADALWLVRDAAPRLGSRRADIAHLAACLLSRGGDPRGAFDELRRAFDEGEWWDRHVLEDDDDLHDVRQLSGFGELVTASDARAREAQREPPPVAVVERPADVARAVVVALHGAGLDGVDTARRWRDVVDLGAVLVAPTSSRRTTPTHRTWPDVMVGGHDVERALREADAPLDVPVVLGGFSAGGRQALFMTLTADPEAPQRFLVVCPALGRVELDPGTVRRAGQRGVRGRVVLGSHDEAYDAVTAAVVLLNDGGVVTELDVVDGLGHDYPSDFSARLGDALADLLRD